MMDGKYVCKTKLLDLDRRGQLPRRRFLWSGSTTSGNGVEQAFIDYALPLIQGEPELPKENALPRFAKLKKVRA